MTGQFDAPYGHLLGRTLPDADERALDAQHNAAIAHVLPVLGPLMGLAVILFGAWDYWIDPAGAVVTVPLRIALVALGALAYRQGPWRRTPVQRCAWIYATHASAMTVAAALLDDGLVLGLAGITAPLYPMALVALRLKTFVLLLLVPALLFALLCAATLARELAIGLFILYLFAAALAGVLMMTIGAFRRRAYLFEKTLLHTARHDSLSGASTRGYMTELANREVALAKRHRRPLAAAMLDIDHFKRINDTYGHAVGDLVIVQLVQTCMRNLRTIDHFGRIGGEEFACAMPETTAPQAMAVAERMRSSIAALRIDTPQGPLQFTISIGVAVLDPERDDWQALLEEADRALYRAKAAGRNRTVLAERNRRGEVAS